MWRPPDSLRSLRSFVVNFEVLLSPPPRYLLAAPAGLLFNASGMDSSGQREALLRFLEATPDPVLGLAPDGRVAYANAAGQLILQALRSALDQVVPAPLAPLAATAAPSLEITCQGLVYQFARSRSPSEEILFLHGHEVTAFKEREEELRRELAATRELALHDPLTGLANRVLLDDRLRQALARYPRQPGRTAVAFLDLDDFKQINERYGHQAGDQVLAGVARCVQRLVRPTDTLARMGGDEMVLLLREIGDAAEAKQVCARLQAPLQDLELEGLGRVRVGLSIGLALYPDDGATPEILLRQADQALAAAKARGPGRIVLYRDLRPDETQLAFSREPVRSAGA